ncbi:hypothetical protein NAT51_03665 [Flavobacterium amniphilum]|uniref:hypothetical protein n=1 Tax=Flavobacterium amniphilum TaxID=1834035 RepID=UPI002029BBF8|nr:hypothetical protein [Flavobacterium amniphilum]MCL9804604.1 hypothetical protein [Flavobacterium amniphilum]
MKKSIILLFMGLSVLSCSKDDDSSEKQLKPNFKNMVGDWVYTTIIRADGTEEPYNHWCSTNKDYAHIIENTEINSHYYNPTCEIQDWNCDNYYFNGNRIISCFEEFNNARVTSLTSTTMKLEYDDNKVFGSVSGVARGLILKKQ